MKNTLKKLNYQNFIDMSDCLQSKISSILKNLSEEEIKLFRIDFKNFWKRFNALVQKGSIRKDDFYEILGSIIQMNKSSYSNGASINGELISEPFCFIALAATKNSWDCHDELNVYQEFLQSKGISSSDIFILLARAAPKCSGNARQIIDDFAQKYFEKLRIIDVKSIGEKMKICEISEKCEKISEECKEYINDFVKENVLVILKDILEKER